LTMPTVRATVILATPGADCRQGDWEREERGEERGRRAEGRGRRAEGGGRRAEGGGRERYRTP